MTTINRQLDGTGPRRRVWVCALRVLCLQLSVVFALIHTGCMSSGVDSLRIEPYRPVAERSGEWYVQAHPSLARAEATDDIQAPHDVARAEETVVPKAPKGSRKSPESVPPQDSEAPSEAAMTGAGETNQRVRALEHGDRVTIQLNGPESTRIEDVIDNQGRIKLPLIDSVVFAGRTTAEVEEAIERAYIDGKIYKYINVIVVSLDDEFFVRGEVNKEGRFSLTGNMTLGKALIVAGGYTEFAKRTEVMIRRGDKVLEFNMKKIDTGEAPDPLIRRGDVIVVKRRWVW